MASQRAFLKIPRLPDIGVDVYQRTVMLPRRHVPFPVPALKMAGKGVWLVSASTPLCCTGALSHQECELLFPASTPSWELSRPITLQQVAPIPKSQLPRLPMGGAIWVSKKLVTCSRAHVYHEVRGELSTGLLLLKLFVEHPKGTSSMHGDTLH